VCNIQALSADPSALILSWTGALCTGCTSCVDVCPENALSIGKEIHITHQFFQPAIAAQAEPMRCRECGKVFGTRKSFERVMEILAKQKLDHDGHFEYCEDCRVIKLLESE
jgi:ferredoxin